MSSVINLGLVQAIFVGTTAPTNTNVLWRDTNFTPNIMKYYDTGVGAWTVLTIEEGVVSSASANTSGDGSTTGVALASKPLEYVHVRVDGYFADISYGDKTGDCYWSADGGTTARAFVDLAVSDVLYWNGGTIAPTELTTSNIIKLYQK